MEMLVNNLFSMALMGIPLAFGLIIGAFEVGNRPLSIIMAIGALATFIVSDIALVTANKKARHEDEINREQNIELIKLLDRLNKTLRDK
jgi:hypothetical protein